MPRTALTVTTSARAGTVLPSATAADVGSGNSIVNTGDVIILAKNTNAGSTARTVTVALTGTIDGQAVSSRSISIAAGATKILGPYSTTNYGTSLSINGDHAEVTFQVIRLGSV